MLAKSATLTLGLGALAWPCVLVASLRRAGSRSDGGGAADGNVTLNVATVNNPQMKDMEKLKSEYESANPGIKVNFQSWRRATCAAPSPPTSPAGRASTTSSPSAPTRPAVGRQRAGSWT